MHRDVKVTALLKGGMGNQLFIYAAARQVVSELEQRGVEAKLELDTSFYLFDPRYRMSCEVERLGLPYDRMRGSWAGLARQKAIRMWERWGGAARPGTFGIFPEAEPTAFSPILGGRTPKRSIVISGYRQNIAYFDGGSAIGRIRRELNESAPAGKAADVSPRDIGLHLRVLYSPTGNVYNPARWSSEVKDYYVRSALALHTESPVGECWVFGDHAETQDDLVGALEARGMPARAWRSEFQDDAVSDFHQMRRFRRFVIGDSTFAWWSAYLASDAERVMLPRDVYQSRAGQVFGACRLV